MPSRIPRISLERETMESESLVRGNFLKMGEFRQKSSFFLRVAYLGTDM
jgi:hypothetical protein